MKRAKELSDVYDVNSDGISRSKHLQSMEGVDKPALLSGKVSSKMLEYILTYDNKSYFQAYPSKAV